MDDDAAIASALLYVGDEIAKLREAIMHPAVSVRLPMAIEQVEVSFGRDEGDRLPATDARHAPE